MEPQAEASTPDPAAHGNTVSEPWARDSKATLASSATLVQAAVLIVAFFAVAGGAVMVIAGKVDDDGGFFDTPYTYDLRTPGTIILALGLLVGPISWLIAKAVEVWAKEN